MDIGALSLLAQVEIPGWVMLLIVAAVFVVPFVLGALLGRALRVKDLSFKIGVVLFAAVLGLTPFVWQSIVGAVEQSYYEEGLEIWENRQLPEAERAKFEQALDELRKAKPELRIER